MNRNKEAATLDVSACPLGFRIYLSLRRNFRKALDEQLAMQWKSRQVIRKVQEERLQELIMHAYRDVPFYRKKMDRAGVKPQDIRCADDLVKMPMTTKEELRSAMKDKSCLSLSLPKRRFVHEMTSGSTNEPFVFIKDRDEEMLENCCALRLKIIGGHKIYKPTLLMRGMQPKQTLKQKILGSSKRHFMCLFDITPESIPRYIESIRKWKIDAIDCFPSGAVEIANYAIDNGIDVQVSTVICGGEKLSRKTREILERGFHAKVLETYGSAENMEIGYQCAPGSGLHVDTSRYIVEILEDGKKVKDGKEGDVVVTNLMNRVMPFIRYSMGDRSAYTKSPCGCKRSFPTLESIRGRTLTNMRTSDGRVLNYHFFSSILEEEHDKISRFQVVIESKDRLTVYIVPNKRFNSSLAASLNKRIAHHAGPSVKTKLSVVKSIPRGRTGKIEMMKSETVK